MKKIVKSLLLVIGVFILSGCSGESSSFVINEEISDENMNTIPIAHAGTYTDSDRPVVNYSIFKLDGTLSSDADNDYLTYSWSIISKPEGSETELDDFTLDTPSFMADKYGDYEFELIVSDGIDDSIANNVIIQTHEDFSLNEIIPPTTRD